SSESLAVVSRIQESALDTTGDLLKLMEAGRQQVKGQAGDQAAASFAQVLNQLPREFLSSSPEMRMCLEMAQQPAAVARLLELRPHNSQLWRARGRLYASRRQWAQASADFAKTLDLRTADDSGAGARPELAAVQMRAAVIHTLAALRL